MYVTPKVCANCGNTVLCAVIVAVMHVAEQVRKNHFISNPWFEKWFFLVAEVTKRRWEKSQNIMVQSTWNLLQGALTSINCWLAFDKWTSPSRQQLIEGTRRMSPWIFGILTTRSEAANLVCGQQRDSAGNSYCATTVRVLPQLAKVSESNFTQCM